MQGRVFQRSCTTVAPACWMSRRPPAMDGARVVSSAGTKRAVQTRQRRFASHFVLLPFAKMLIFGDGFHPPVSQSGICISQTHIAGAGAPAPKDRPSCHLLRQFNSGSGGHQHAVQAFRSAAGGGAPPGGAKGPGIGPAPPGGGGSPVWPSSVPTGRAIRFSSLFLGHGSGLRPIFVSATLINRPRLPGRWNRGYPGHSPRQSGRILFPMPSRTRSQPRTV